MNTAAQHASAQQGRVSVPCRRKTPKTAAASGGACTLGTVPCRGECRRTCEGVLDLGADALVPRLALALALLAAGQAGLTGVLRLLLQHSGTCNRSAKGLCSGVCMATAHAEGEISRACRAGNELCRPVVTLSASNTDTGYG